MTKKDTTEKEERLDRARKPVTFSALEWVLAAVGLAGAGCGASMIREGSAGGGAVLAVGVVCIIAFAVILVAKKRRD